MMTLQEKRNLYKEIFGDCSCCEEVIGTREQYDEAIADCMAMIQYSIDLNDKQEAAYFRKLLQENKVQKRRIVNP